MQQETCARVYMQYNATDYINAMYQANPLAPTVGSPIGLSGLGVFDFLTHRQAHQKQLITGHM